MDVTNYVKYYWRKRVVIDGKRRHGREFLEIKVEVKRIRITELQAHFFHLIITAVTTTTENELL